MDFRYVSRFLFLLKSAGAGSMISTVKKTIRCGGKPMTAIVLAGGRGSRMKADKAGLAVGGRTLLEHVVDQLEPYYDEILVSVSPRQKIIAPASPRNRGGWPGELKAGGGHFGLRVIEDETPGQGPLGGILAGLRAAANDVCAVVACDIPDIDVPLLRSLARAAVGADIAVPAGPAGHYEPLFAVYRKAVVPKIEALLHSGERSIIPLFDRCRTVVVKFKDAARLRNLNTRTDYEAFLRSLAERPPGADRIKGPDGRRGQGRL